MNLIIAAFRSKLTLLLGSIPGAAIALTELADLLDGDPSTVFEVKVFALAVVTMVGFFVAKDANVSGKG